MWQDRKCVWLPVLSLYDKDKDLNSDGICRVWGK